MDKLFKCKYYIIYSRELSIALILDAVLLLKCNRFFYKTNSYFYIEITYHYLKIF